MKDYELLGQPLFLGMSQAELTAFRAGGLISNTMMPKGSVLAEEDVRAESLTIVTEGKVLCRTFSYDKSYFIEEDLNAPVVIQPERLFGLSQRFASTFTAITACSVMNIKKVDVVRMMDESMIFRINYLNVVTSLAEKLEKSLWLQKPEDLPHKIVRFIKDRCFYPAGKKLLRIHMVDLARELGCSRLEVSKALHELEDRELIRIKRGGVEVPMMELLITS